MDCPKVSVIVPIYNAEEFLDEALDSLEAQQFDSFEVILVNDGSTDSSGDIAKARAAASERFHYFETENQGPGAARNFALTQAKGKYIAFCDSDDMIPPFAYKHMYALAEKHNCDIVIGSAGRFNSEKRMPSRLHRKALTNLDELVHITTHPQLIYDTTACKNMYSRAFLDRIDFQFPEGMVFEDMPAMIKLQYRAKTVAFLDEVVYMWRIRDKESQSITQDKVAVGALEDRIKAMRMTDAFFDENVSEQDLIRAKNRKWLANDLMIYIRQLPEIENEQRREEMRAIILDFADSIDESAYEDIDAIDRIKYHFLKLGDYTQLTKALEFSNDRYDEANATLSADGQYYGVFGFDGLPSSLTNMTQEIARRCLQTSIESVTLGDEGLAIEGNLKMRGVLSKPDDLYEIELDLHPIVHTAGEEQVLEVTAVEAQPEPSANRADAVRYTCHFSAKLSSEQISQLENGTYKLAVRARFNGLALDRIMLKNPAKERAAKPFAYLLDSRISTVLYNSLREFKLSIEDLTSPIITRMEDAGTHLAATDSNGITHQIAYENIDLDNHRIGDPMDRQYYFLALDPIACTYKDGILRMSRISSGQPYITLFENAALMLDAHLEGTVLSLTMKPAENLKDTDGLRFAFFNENGLMESGPAFTSKSYDGLHLVEIDFRKLNRYPFEEKTVYNLQGLCNLEGTFPLIRDTISCKKAAMTLTCKGQEYEITIANSGCKVKAHTISAIKRRLKTVTGKTRRG